MSIRALLGGCVAITLYYKGAREGKYIMHAVVIFFIVELKRVG